MRTTAVAMILITIAGCGGTLAPGSGGPAGQPAPGDGASVTANSDIPAGVYVGTRTLTIVLGTDGVEVDRVTQTADVATTILEGGAPRFGTGAPAVGLRFNTDLNGITGTEEIVAIQGDGERFTIRTSARVTVEGVPLIGRSDYVFEFFAPDQLRFTQTMNLAGQAEGRTTSLSYQVEGNLSGPEANSPE